MTAEDIEQQIRRHPTANERFLLGLLDEARGVTANGCLRNPGDGCICDRAGSKHDRHHCGHGSEWWES